MTNNTEMDERLWRLLEVSDILDEIDHRLSVFIENFVKIETNKVKATGWGEKDRTIVKLELEGIKNVYVQEIEKRKQEYMQEIFSKMKSDLCKITPEEIEIVIKFFESGPGRNFKNIIIPLSEKMDEAINKIGKDIIEEAMDKAINKIGKDNEGA